MAGELQKQTAQAIVNIFETGKARGDYGRVTLLTGDSGHLTYGRAQTTLASGNLYLLIKAYCDTPSAPHARALKPYLPRLADSDLRLDHDAGFRQLLADCGHDPQMHEAQDQFFDRVYWQPAVHMAKAMGAHEALSLAVLYDSMIHGSLNLIRRQVEARHGKLGATGERQWIATYVNERRTWLASHGNKLLHKTVYRMDAFVSLIGQGNWSLDLPVSICGVRLDAAALGYHAAVPVSAIDPGTRNLRLTQPPMTGNDVRALEEALAGEGYIINRDGVFDRGLEDALKMFQAENGLIDDGIAGPATRLVLGL